MKYMQIKYELRGALIQITQTVSKHLSWREPRHHLLPFQKPKTVKLCGRNAFNCLLLLYKLAERQLANKLTSQLATEVKAII